MNLADMASSVDSFFDSQLSVWRDARDRYEALEHVMQREIFFGDFPVRLQCNPSRIVSTGAKVDAASISKRPCFLCRCNRPAEQMIDSAMVEGYDFLVNPFPIFKHHFTISCVDHRHQDEVDLTTIALFAESNPDMVAFYNGSASGASAPDHLHFQAGNIDFLPLCRYVADHIGECDERFSDIKVYRYPELPMKFIRFSLSTTDEQSLREVLTRIDALSTDRSMRNILMFSIEPGSVEVLLFPRRNHRPSCYYAQDESQRMISPGAVDMAGVLILPRIDDYDTLTADEISKVYAEVGVDDSELKSMIDRLVSN